MLDWTKLLDPANGGPGEPPGYREAFEAAKAAPPKEKKRASSKRAKPKPNRFPSAKHASQD